MTMNKAYNSTWFTYNELSQITPMPMAWDVTSATGEPGSGGCTTSVSDCAKVYAFLDSQSKALSSWASLQDLVGRRRAVEAERLQLRRQLHVRAEPLLLRRPDKPHLAAFQEVPFTTESAEYNVLQAGATRRQPEDRRRVPADHGRADQAGQRHRRDQPGPQLHPRPAVRVGHQLLPGELPVHHRQRADHQAAVLPRGARLPDEPAGHHQRAAAAATGSTRSGRSAPTRRRSTCRPRASRATRSRTTRPRRSQLLTSNGWHVVRQRLHDLPDAVEVRARRQAGAAAHLHPAVRDRDRLDRRRR